MMFAIRSAVRRAPPVSTEIAPGLHADRAFDGVSEPRWRELGRRDQFEDPLRGQAFRSQLLLGFPSRKQTGRPRQERGQRVCRARYCIQPGSPRRGSAEASAGTRAIPFEDYSFGQSTGQFRECLLRQFGSREQTPCEPAQTAASPGLDRCRQQGGADRASAGRDQYLVYPYGLVPFVASGAFTDITRIDQTIGDLRCRGEARFQRNEAGIAVDEDIVEIGRTRSMISRCRLASSGTTTMSRTEHSTRDGGQRDRAASISGSSSKRNARRPNGKASITTASGRAASKAASNASRRVAAIFRRSVDHADRRVL